LSLAESPTRPPFYALDTRSLATARIALGSLLLLDLALRAFDLRAHYTDDGVLPRALIPPGSWDVGWSLHRLGGGSGFEAALFVVHALLALAMVLGWRTFWTTAGTALLTISLHGRNPLLRDGQDDLLRVLLVWATLLPWGARWSLDARAGKAWHPLGLPPGALLTGPAAAGFVGQLVLVYTSSAVAKLESTWWRSGDALSLALSIGRYETPLGQWLLRFPELLQVMSYAAVAFELLAPLLVLAGPRPRWRLALVGAFWAFHISLGAMLRLGLFAPIAMAAWSALLPGTVWPARTEVRAVGVLATPRATRVGWAVVAPLLALVVLANASYLWPRGIRLEPVGETARALGLQQYWSVFSPPYWTQGALVDGWFSIEGNQPGGHSLELLTGGELAVTRPRMGSDRFSNRRWRHWAAAMMEDWPRGSIQRRTVEDARLATLRWWCGDWNGRHGAERVEVVRLVWMRQRLRHPEDVPERRVLAQGVCQPPPVAAVR
jgi:hypothetical protein